MRDNRQDPTPYVVICKAHGLVFLSEDQYDHQAEHPHEAWKCPLCGEEGDWDTACQLSSPPEES